MQASFTGELLWQGNRRWRTSGSTFSMDGCLQTAGSSSKAFTLTVTPSGSRLHEQSSPCRGCCSTFGRGRLSATSWPRYGKRQQARTGSKSHTPRERTDGVGSSLRLSHEWPLTPGSGKLGSRPVGCTSCEPAPVDGKAIQRNCGRRIRRARPIARRHGGVHERCVRSASSRSHSLPA